MTDQSDHRGAGRPLKFQSNEDLQTQIELYFAECDRIEDTRKFSHDEGLNGVCQNCGKKGEAKGCLLISGRYKIAEPYTVGGLAAWLGTTRKTLLDYEERDEFSNTIKAAKQR